jgi:hypothetical protein
MIKIFRVGAYVFYSGKEEFARVARQMAGLESHDSHWFGRVVDSGIVKMRCTISMITIAALILCTTRTIACTFDTDCSPGSTCVKSSGQVLGICTGGRFPGNRYDQKPYSDPFDPNRTVGKTCSFKIECGPGNHCAMGSGIYGVCVRP